MAELRRTDISFGTSSFGVFRRKEGCCCLATNANDFALPIQYVFQVLVTLVTTYDNSLVLHVKTNKYVYGENKNYLK